MARVDINRILRSNPRPCKYGAPLGASSYHAGGDVKLYVQRVRLVDGCYAADGTYWGGPSDLWCAFAVDDSARLYVRAPNRTATITELLKDWTFNVHRMRA